MLAVHFLDLLSYDNFLDKHVLKLLKPFGNLILDAYFCGVKYENKIIECVKLFLWFVEIN